MQVLLPRYPCTSQEKRTLFRAPTSFSEAGFITVLDACGTHSSSATPDLGSESKCLLISRRQWKLLSISSEWYSSSLRTQACSSARHRELFPLSHMKSFLTLPNGSCWLVVLCLLDLSVSSVLVCSCYHTVYPGPSCITNRNFFPEVQDHEARNFFSSEGSLPGLQRAAFHWAHTTSSLYKCRKSIQAFWYPFL